MPKAAVEGKIKHFPYTKKGKKAARMAKKGYRMSDTGMMKG